MRSLLFAFGFLVAVLPSGPIIREGSDLVGIPLQGPVIVVWFLSVAFTSRRPASGLFIALSLIVISALSVGSGSGAELRVWVGVVVVPLMMFFGLQLANYGEFLSARKAMRGTLLIVVGLQTFNLISHAGSALLSPSYVFERHTDIVFWQAVGGNVLGNPNNASVVFVAALAWAVAEIALGTSTCLTPILLGLSVVSIWATGSRGAIVIAVMLVLVSMLLNRPTRLRFFMTACLGAGALITFNVWYASLTPYLYNVGDSWVARWEARLETVSEVMAHPFGTGAGTVDRTLREPLAAVFGGNDNGATSHDVFLNWGIAVGWIGLAILLGALIVAWQRSARPRFFTSLPLIGFLATAQSAGIDLLNETNPAWAIVLWGFMGLAWRGGIVASDDEPSVNLSDVPLTLNHQHR